jgi:hypothetical protein
LYLLLVRSSNKRGEKPRPGQSTSAVSIGPEHENRQHKFALLDHAIVHNLALLPELLLIRRKQPTSETGGTENPFDLIAGAGNKRGAGAALFYRGAREFQS